MKQINFIVMKIDSENKAFPVSSEYSNSRHFSNSEISKSLEGITLKSDSMNENSLLEILLSDKSKTLKSTIKALLNEIELREDLDMHLLSKISEDLCEQNTNLDHLKNMKVQYSFELWENVNKSRIQIENQLLELEKEKRKEYLECWRDLMFLKKYLLSALREYWDLVKRRDMLEEK